jgi:prepilin signal peptidase PulO-like enzyme (type II secretory pathway)
MQYFAGAIIFLFGASLGSFVLVIAERYKTGFSFFKGRSICFSCSQKLRSKDLFPVFSFLALRGRCRHCQAKIPSLAFWVEVVMGGLAVLAAQKAGILASFQFVVFNLQTIFNFLILNFIFATILLISVYDLKHFIIPDSFLLVLLFLAFLHNS